VLRYLKPNRIGHGIRAAYNDEALKALSHSGAVLEICPSSNLYTHAVKDMNELGFILGRFKEWKIPFTINTDGPYLLKTHLAQEALMLLDANILTEHDVKNCFAVAQKASFIQ